MSGDIIHQKFCMQSIVTNQGRVLYNLLPLSLSSSHSSFVFCYLCLPYFPLHYLRVPFPPSPLPLSSSTPVQIPFTQSPPPSPPSALIAATPPRSPTHPPPGSYCSISSLHPNTRPSSSTFCRSTSPCNIQSLQTLNYISLYNQPPPEVFKSPNTCLYPLPMLFPCSYSVPI